MGRFVWYHPIIVNSKVHHRTGKVFIVALVVYWLVGSNPAKVMDF
jgi:hypothetical protein